MKQISKRQTNLMVALLFLGGFIMLLGETFMNNALPQVMHDLHVNQSTAQWVTTGYLMVSGLMIPVSAWSFRRFPLRETFATLMLIFLVGCLISWSAPNFVFLLTGRLFQAVAAGAIIPLTNNVLLVVYPAAIRGTVMGISGIVIAFAPAIGPTLSGYIIDNYGWRMLFGLLAPLSALILVICWFTTKNITKTSRVKLDWTSLILELLGIGGILYALSAIGNDGQITMTVTSSLLVGIVLTVAFVHHSLHIKNPLMDLNVFRYPAFNLLTFLSSTTNIALVGIELVMPLYNQDVRGLSAFQSGLTLLLGALVMGIGNPIMGLLADRLGVRKLAIGGNIILALGTVPMIFFDHRTSLLVIILAYALRAVGMSMVMMPTFSASMNALPQAKVVDGNSAGSTIRQIAGSLGTALMMMIVSLCSQGATHLQAMTNGYQAADLAAEVVAIISLIASCLAFDTRSNDKLTNVKLESQKTIRS